MSALKIMDQSGERISKYKCCANIQNPKCSQKNLRYISSAVIDKIHSWGYNHKLDETMHICESCRGILAHNRNPTTKKRRSDGNEAHCEQKFNDPQPSTSYQEPGKKSFHNLSIKFCVKVFTKSY